MQKLQTEGAETIRLGGGFRHFLPGVPAGGGWLVDYFSRTGFAVRGTVYDVRGNLRGFSAPPSAQRALAAAGASVSLCQPVDIAALMSFLLAEFPGRWRFDIAWYLEHGGKPQDIVLLRQGLQVVGFAHTYNPRSVFLGSPIYWHRLLGRRYGGLGPIGVAASVRGKGLGLALLQLALQHLARLGVCGAAIDWTDLTDFYARAGFAPWKTYTCMYWPGPARGAA
jgi:GNAT superfamily N-acetyltransferase